MLLEESLVTAGTICYSLDTPSRPLLHFIKQVVFIPQSRLSRGTNVSRSLAEMLVIFDNQAHRKARLGSLRTGQFF